MGLRANYQYLSDKDLVALKQFDNDDDIFAGHCITVGGSLKKGITSASMGGWDTYDKRNEYIRCRIYTKNM